MREKALVLLSGGLDSTTALAWAIEKYRKENVQALILKYGQKHDRELLCAFEVCEHYGVQYDGIDLPLAIWEKSDCTLLKGRNNVTEGTYAKQIEAAKGKPIDTSVPFRNGVFLSTATAVSMSYKCNYLITGIHQDDSGAAYPDCSFNFLCAIGSAIEYGTNKQVKLLSPFGSWTKDKIVEWGLEHNVPYHLTWSCYKGGKLACGKCATCIDRQQAFAVNGKEDPIEYETYIDFHGPAR